METLNWSLVTYSGAVTLTLAELPEGVQLCVMKQLAFDLLSHDLSIFSPPLLSLDLITAWPFFLPQCLFNTQYEFVTIFLFCAAFQNLDWRVGSLFLTALISRDTDGRSRYCVFVLRFLHSPAFCFPLCYAAITHAAKPPRGPYQPSSHCLSNICSMWWWAVRRFCSTTTSRIRNSPILQWY